MRFSEKMQYKLKNLIYEQERRRNHKVQSYKSTTEKGAEGTGSKFIAAIDEMDTYLSEKMKDVHLPKMKK